MMCLGRAKAVIPKNAQSVVIIYDQSFLISGEIWINLPKKTGGVTSVKETPA